MSPYGTLKTSMPTLNMSALRGVKRTPSPRSTGVAAADPKNYRHKALVDDRVAGLVLLMNFSADLPKPVNLGNPAEITIKELADESTNGFALPAGISAAARG